MNFSSNLDITYTNTTTQEVINGSYSVDQGTGYVVLNLPFVSNDFETLTDEWRLEKCTETRLDFFPKRNTNSTDNSLIIERVCSQ